MVTYRSFKQSTFRVLLSKEFFAIVESFVEDNLGSIITVRLEGSSKDSKVFVKKMFKDLPIDKKSYVEESIYNQKYTSKPPISISDKMVEAVQNKINS